MSRITIKTDWDSQRPIAWQPKAGPVSRLVLGMLLACLALTACSSGYEQSKLGPDSEIGRQIQQMLADLRQAGAQGMDSYLQKHGAPNLTADQQAALRAAMSALLQAGDMQLVSLDRFGEQVLRAGLSRSTPQDPTTHYFLLIIKDGKPLWAGMN